MQRLFPVLAVLTSAALPLLAGCADLSKPEEITVVAEQRPAVAANAGNAAANAAPGAAAAPANLPANVVVNANGTQPAAAVRPVAPQAVPGKAGGSCGE